MSTVEDAAEAASRKRKFDSDEDSERNGPKRKLVEQETDEPDLLDLLADEVLMEILTKLDGESLHNLGS